MLHLWSVQNLKIVLDKLGPRDPSQPWIMMENETHLRANIWSRLKYEDLNGVFNRTFYFRTDSDIRLVHGFIVRRGIESKLLPRHWVIEPEMESVDYSRQLAVAFISDCEAYSGRLNYIAEMKKHARVDLYGKCGNLTCGASHIARDRYRPDTDYCLRLAASKYLFYLAFENSLCAEYVTEKVYNLMYYSMVPVVLGGADYASVLPPNSYIDARKYTPAELVKKLKYLASHPKEYEFYLEWKKYYQPSTIGGANVFCDLCKRLHDDDFYEKKTIDDFVDWFVTKSHCGKQGYIP